MQIFSTKYNVSETFMNKKAMMVLRMAHQNYRPRCPTCQGADRDHHCPSGYSQAVLLALLKQNQHQYQTLTHYVYFNDAVFH